MDTPLQASASVTLNAAGGGQVGLGPGSPGQSSANRWEVDNVVWQTTRPGIAPVPTIQIYLASVTPAQSQVVDYDGSFGSASGSVTVPNGLQLFAVWTGGQAGDVATLTATGTKS